jgi:hypothetical protein
MREQEHLSSSGGTSGRNGQTELRPEKRVICPRASSSALPTTSGQGRHRLPVGSARTWLQQQYFSARCRNHRPPKGGISRESSRISWRMSRSDGPKALPPEGRGTPRSIAPRLPDLCGKPRSTPGARATRRLRPQVASATSTTTATDEPTSTRGCAEATTPGVGDATTAGRIGVPSPNHPVRRLSAGPYDGRRSRPGSEPRLPSQSTQGRRGWNCGSRTTDWPASWVERTMTTSSSATSPVPLRHRSSLARASASGADLQLGQPGPSLRRQLPGHVCAPWELLGSPKLPPASGRVSPGLHPTILEAAHRAAQRHRLGCHRLVPRRHHLPRPGEQAGSQDPPPGRAS